MLAEQVSVMVVDCDVDEVGLELTSCLLLDFSESFALRSLWRIPSREKNDFGGMASTSTIENVMALTRATIKHARGRSAGVVDGYRGWRPAAGRRFGPIEIYDCVAPPSGAHLKVKQALLI